MANHLPAEAVNYVSFSNQIIDDNSSIRMILTVAKDKTEKWLPQTRVRTSQVELPSAIEHFLSVNNQI